VIVWCEAGQGNAHVTVLAVALGHCETFDIQNQLSRTTKTTDMTVELKPLIILNSVCVSQFL